MSDGTTGFLTKPLMFLSSYAPLLLILAIRFEGFSLRIICVSLAVIGIVGLFVLMRFQHDAPEQRGRHTLIEARQAGEGASSYLAGYLLPFVIVDRPSMTDLAAYVGFFVVAYFITTRTRIVQVNPTLFLFGYSIYSITDTNGSERYLISRTKETITKNSTVLVSRMTNDVLLFEETVNTHES